MYSMNRSFTSANTTRSPLECSVIFATHHCTCFFGGCGITTDLLPRPLGFRIAMILASTCFKRSSRPPSKISSVTAGLRYLVSHGSSIARTAGRIIVIMPSTGCPSGLACVSSLYSRTIRVVSSPGKCFHLTGLVTSMYLLPCLCLMVQPFMNGVPRYWLHVMLEHRSHASLPVLVTSFARKSVSVLISPHTSRLLVSDTMASHIWGPHIAGRCLFSPRTRETISRSCGAGLPAARGLPGRVGRSF